ncbi:MAG: extracellular solute-binding protein [Bifidobacteriaceae bacterium]|jgi:ABC-type glycerol-3-phosphate transport system substrate-binding protein|nr:extracellular solute-binding protein [Bifidobacteriaceae bacterium]
MRKLQTRSLVAFGAAITMAATLAACGGGDDKDSGTTGGDTTASSDSGTDAGTDTGSDAGTDTGGEAASDVSGEITWYSWSPDTPVAEKYIAEFNKEYPNIKVTYKNFENVDYRASLIPSLDSGSGPDVYCIGAGADLTDTWGAYAMDLTDLAKEYLGDDYVNQFAAGYAETLQDSDGRQVALPLGGQAAGFMWYNKNIFDEAGVAAPPATYDEWKDACAKIEEAGYKCFAMGAGGEDTFPTEMYHSIANSVDPEFFLKAATGLANWDDPEGIQVLEIFKQLKDDGIIPANVLDAGQYPLANEEFMKGEAAMVQMGMWYAQYSGAESCLTAMESAGVSNPSCFVQMPMNFPDVAQKGNGSEVFGEVDYGMAVNEDSKNPEAAKTFVAWLTMTKTGQQNTTNAIDTIPALKGVYPDWSAITLVDQSVQQPALEDLMAQSAASSQTRQSQTTEETLRAMVVAIQEVLDPTINKSIEDIAADFQKASVPTDPR